MCCPGPCPQNINVLSRTLLQKRAQWLCAARAVHTLEVLSEKEQLVSMTLSTLYRKTAPPPNALFDCPGMACVKETAKKKGQAA